MNAWSRWLERRRVDRELKEEIASHIEHRTAELIESGISADDAEARARQKFGNIGLKIENSRAAWGWNGVEQLLQDVRFGIRVLAKSPAFTLTAMAVLSLGIGMNTAIFSAVKTVLLSALPYSQPDRLVQVWQTGNDGRLMRASGPDFRDWQQQNRSMKYLASYDFTDCSLAGDFRPRRIQVSIVSRDFFPVMGNVAAMGRTFSATDQTHGSPPTLVLGYELSQALFGSGAQALGRVVRVNGMSFTVIGILPPKFNFPAPTQAWIPQAVFADDQTYEAARSAHNYYVIGRMRDALSLKQAQGDLNVVATRLARAYADDKDQGIRVVSLYNQVVGSVRPALLMLLAAVGLVLLIACVNITNLQLARAAIRMKELGLRTALGAGRGRLIRQLLTESVLLAGAGGAVGLGLAWGGVSLLRRFAPVNIPRLQEMHVDATILLFTLFLSLSAGVLFGVLPAFVGSQTDTNEALKEGSGKTTAGPGLKRWGNVLVISQVTLAIVLLSGAVLLSRSFWKLAHVPSGLKSEGVFTADITWPTVSGSSSNGKETIRLSKDLLTRLSRVPGLEAAAFINTLPVRDGGADGAFEIEGKPLPADPHDAPDAFYRLASSEYFKAFGLPILAGRGFDARDEVSAQQVAIVNQSFARKFFPGQDVIGKRIRFLGFDFKPQFLTIVGLTADVHAFGLNRPADAEVFAEYMQHSDMAVDATLVVRGRFANQAAIRSIISSINPDTPIEFQSMDDVIAGTIVRERFQTSLLAVFAAFALLLSVVGIYGLLAYTVTRRTSELGIRMALGASQQSVLAMVLAEGGKLVLIGTLLGLSCALLLSRTLTGLLYGVAATDPASYLIVVASFASIALAACYIPGWRASRIDPNAALRYE